MSKETGTVKELDLKPGDVVQFAGQSDPDHGMMIVERVSVIAEGEPFAGQIRMCLSGYGYVIFNDELLRIISRASDDTPKLWRDMSDEEKGALLLAHHEGKVIQVWENGVWISDPVAFHGMFAYRVKPEPVRETVTSYWCPKWGMRIGNPVHDTTHRITFDLIDGEPDCDSIQMEDL